MYNFLFPFQWNRGQLHSNKIGRVKCVLVCFSYGRFHGQISIFMTSDLSSTYVFWREESNETNYSFIAAAIQKLWAFQKETIYIFRLFRLKFIFIEFQTWLVGFAIKFWWIKKNNNLVKNYRSNGLLKKYIDLLSLVYIIAQKDVRRPYDT